MKAKTRGKPGEPITSRKRYIKRDEREIMSMLNERGRKWAAYLTEADLTDFKEGMKYAMKARRHMFEARFETSEKLFMNFHTVCASKNIPPSVVFRDFMLAFIKANGNKRQLSTSLTDINLALNAFHKLGRIRENLISIISRAVSESNGEIVESDVSELIGVVDSAADVRNAQRQYVFGLEKSILSKPSVFVTRSIDGEGSTAWDDLKQQNGEEE